MTGQTKPPEPAPSGAPATWQEHRARYKAEADAATKARDALVESNRALAKESEALRAQLAQATAALEVEKARTAATVDLTGAIRAGTEALGRLAALGEIEKKG